MMTPALLSNGSRQPAGDLLPYVRADALAWLLLPALALVLPGDWSSRLLMACEVTASLWCAYRLLCAKTSRDPALSTPLRLHLGIGFLTLAGSDIGYDLGGLYPALLFLATIGESLYTVFFCAIAHLVWYHWWAHPGTEKKERTIGVIMALIFFLLHLEYILLPQPAVHTVWQAADRIHDYLYSALTAWTLAGVFFLSARLTDLCRTKFFLGLCLCLLSDFSLRSHFAGLGTPPPPAIMIAWTSGVVLLAVSIGGTQSLGTDPPARARLAPFNSLRCNVSFAAFLVGSVLFIGSFLAGLLHLDNAHHLSCALVLFWLPWCCTSLIGFAAGRRIDRLQALMPGATVRDISHSADVEQDPPGPRSATGIFEIDMMLQRYEALAARTAEMDQELLLNNRDAEVGRLTAQVAHDLQSPLLALETLMGDLRGVDRSSRRLMHAAMRRICAISGDILVSHRQTLSTLSVRPVPLLELLREIVAEKQAQHRRGCGPKLIIHSPEGAEATFVSLAIEEGKRALTNLIDNAIEASGPDEPVDLVLGLEQEAVILSIVDRGPGLRAMRPDQLSRRGVSGKKYGHGLGLSSAADTIAKSGGHIALKDSPAKGLTVEVSLPRARAPSWFCGGSCEPRWRQVVFCSSSTASCLDDIAQAIKDAGCRVTMVEDVEHLVSFLADSSTSAESLVVLEEECDGEGEGGICLASRLHIARQTLVISTSVLDPQLQDLCGLQGARLCSPESAVHLVTSVLRAGG